MKFRCSFLWLIVFVPWMVFGEPWLTLEQFGGQAYYKRFDGDLTYTPQSVDPSITNGAGLPPGSYTKIAYTGSGQVFDQQDLNKSFCGLFVHRNPANADTNLVDLFYPNIVGSRYAKVVRVIDGRNILVDFEFNGGSTGAPQAASQRKGYIFFDNSAAWDLMMAAYMSPGNTNTEIRLLPYTVTNGVRSAYVVLQHGLVNMGDKALKIWTGSGMKAWVKLGVEDYFQWGGIGNKAYKQESYLFKINVFDRNIVIHNIVWIPPHRTVPETSSFTRSFFGGSSIIGPCERILAVLGNTALDEKREISAGGGLTEELFQCVGLGFVYSGGKYAGDGVASDITAYQYIFIKDFEHAGVAFVDLKANSGAGNYLVMQNVSTDFQDQKKWRPTSALVDVRMTTDKTGFDTGLVARTYYPEEVFEIVSGHSFHQVDNSYHLEGWGNRANIIQIGRFAFTIGNHGTWKDIYERVHSEGQTKFQWNVPAGAYKFRLGRKHMLVQRIPRNGSRYWASRDYMVTGDSIPRIVSTVSSNRIRGFVNWSVILGKTVAQIDPATDIPANAKPIQLQAGDRFVLVGRGSQVYTVLDNDRGPWSQFNTEYTGYETYNYSRHTLDRNLPGDLPLAFEIEMVESTSEHLLDGAVRPAYLVYKYNMGWNSTTTTQFGASSVLQSDGLGHLSYNHRQFALWADNVSHVGVYRQSSVSSGTQYPVVDPDSGTTSSVNRLGWYSPGYVLINSSGFQGQFTEGMNDFYNRDLIERGLGMTVPDELKAKLRLYNCSNVTTSGVVGGGQFVELYASAQSAPDMPAPCRALLNDLSSECGIDPPTITVQPVNKAVNGGQPATFSVTASGTEPLYYQWQKNTVDISGAIGTNYTIAAAAQTDEGSFRCIVTNVAGTATSSAATLTVTVYGPPTIVVQPVNKAAYLGQPATFSVIASGTPPLYYQWQKNTVNISGAIAANYTIAAAAQTDEGSFRCIVTNVLGTATSSAATLTVNDPPPPNTYWWVGPDDGDWMEGNNWISSAGPGVPSEFNDPYIGGAGIAKVSSGPTPVSRTLRIGLAAGDDSRLL
ncbi:MAG: immunoglobulin domain-containing protein [Kiritimatiellia bacterium]